MSDNGSLKEIILRVWTVSRIAITRIGLGTWFWTRKMLRLSKEDKVSIEGLKQSEHAGVLKHLASISNMESADLASESPPRKDGYPFIADSERSHSRLCQVEDNAGYIYDETKVEPLFPVSLAEIEEALTGAITHLPEHERLVFTLCYYEELKVGEIGLLLAETESSVQQIHDSALSLLQVQLGKLQ
jgi:RNA polymerase sigma factor (sigma-70 family)